MSTIALPTTTSPAPSPAPPGLLAALRTWVVQRGVLFLLLTTPMLALFGGFLLRYTTLPVSTLLVFGSFALLPLWISYRRSVSRDPDEPVHHIHQYLKWAILPYVTFSVVRILPFYLFGINYWGVWYNFGAQLTGEPPGTLPALIAGMAMYTIQGIALNTSFFVLFRRHSLLNALLYIGVWFSSLINLPESSGPRRQHAPRGPDPSNPQTALRPYRSGRPAGRAPRFHPPAPPVDGRPGAPQLRLVTI